jgi:pre-rRNA-processing protein TSR3
MPLAKQKKRSRRRRRHGSKRLNGSTTKTDRDAWAGGNINRRDIPGSDDTDGEANDSESTDGPSLGEALSLDLPEDEENDEEEMAELRRKVLASKPFSTPLRPEASKGAAHKTLNTELSLHESDAEAGSDNEGYDDFDQIANATPVTDRTGIVARERQRRLESASASFSRIVVAPPKK